MSRRQTPPQWFRVPADTYFNPGALDNLRQEQATSLAFFDVFWLCAVVSAGLVLLVLLMKRSVAEKGERISAE